MKRFLCALLVLSLCLLSAGCAQTGLSGPASQSPAAPEPLAPAAGLPAGLAPCFAQADPARTRLDLPDTPPDSCTDVKITPALLVELGGLLEEGGFRPIDSMRSISGGSQGRYLQLSLGLEEPVTLELFSADPERDAGQYPGQTVLWLQMGESSSQYIAPAETFDQLEQRLRREVYAEQVTLEGAQPIQLTMSGSDPVQDALSCEDQLLVLHRRANDTFYLDLVDPVTGGLSYSMALEGQVSRVEPLYDGNTGFRVYNQASALDYDCNGRLLREFYLSDEDLSRIPAGRGNAFCLRNGHVALSGEDGIYLDGRLVLANSRLKSAMGVHYPEIAAGAPELAPYYTEPRLLMEGRRLAAVVESPGSPAGRVALVLMNLETGGVQHYLDVFDLVCGLEYPDDQTIVATSNRGCAFIQADTGARSDLRSAWSGLDNISAIPSLDYTAAYRFESGRDEEGRSLRLLYRMPVNGDRELLLTARGGRQVYLLDSTEAGLVFSVTDQAGHRFYCLPLEGDTPAGAREPPAGQAGPPSGEPPSP